MDGYDVDEMFLVSIAEELGVSEDMDEEDLTLALSGLDSEGLTRYKNRQEMLKEINKMKIKKEQQQKNFIKGKGSFRRIK